MRVLMVIALTCAILAVASAMPFLENVHQFEQVPVRAFSSLGVSDPSTLLAALLGASSGASSGGIPTISDVPALLTASSGVLSSPSSGLSG